MTAKRILLFALGAGCVLTGCVVPQPPGNGKVMHLVEGQTKRGYWLYLPEDYVKTDGQKPDGGRWPLMMTFHGMKPYDDANRQIRECQQEADRYGFVVCAPELLTCDSFMQFPLRDPDLPYVKKDERCILAIMDEIFRRTQADPTRVLSTGWSSGGYMAHFLVNRYPERFACVAVRQSNFSSEMMDTRQVSKYRDMKIAIFFGENDFPICREESTEAVGWYRQHRFDVTAQYVRGLGHERTPQTAAAFFAQVIGVEPKTPPPLGTRVMHDIVPSGVSGASARVLARAPVKSSAAPAGGAGPASPPRTSANAVFAANKAPAPLSGATVQASPTPRSVGPVAPAGGSTAQPYIPSYKPAPRAPQRTPTRTVALRTGTPGEQDSIRIRVSATIGVTPLWVSYAVDMPQDWREGTSVLWTDNGKPISTAVNGYRWMREAGAHHLEALVITRDDREFRVAETITVLPKLTTRPVAQGEPAEVE